MRSIEAEFKLLKSDVALTENQFFVVLADENISEHEKDVGLAPDTGADIDTRRGRVLSKLRGTGTVTKSMMKNVAASFVNGDIEIIEYPSEYCFAVKFTSRKREEGHPQPTPGTVSQTVHECKQRIHIQERPDSLRNRS